MTTVATELVWDYEPTDLFEAPCEFTLSFGTLTAANGKASLRLKVPDNFLTRDTQKVMMAQVTAAFDARRLLVHRSYIIRGPHIIQHQDDGKRRIAVTLETQTTGNVLLDFVARNTLGQIISDSRADRVRTDQAFVSGLASKSAKSPLLASLLQSFGAAFSDPDNEFVHLYEIREALSSHYGKEESARSALRISKYEWRQLGRLANEEPLREGRHRGRRITENRWATQEELIEARRLAKLLILRFADTVS